MSLRSVALLAALTLGCGRTGFSDSGANPGPTPFAGRTWHSWDVTFSDAGPLKGTVTDTAGNVSAFIDCWISQDFDDPDFAASLDQFNPGAHPDGFNRASTWWSASASNYPYCGKSDVPRGSDGGESGAPEPLGVYDLQVHPPDGIPLIVAVFVVPTAGTYAVSGIASRRVDSGGGSATSAVYDAGSNALGSSFLTPNNDRIWDVAPGELALGVLSSGDVVHFVVQRNGDYAFDAVELVWTLRSLP